MARKIAAAGMQLLVIDTENKFLSTGGWRKCRSNPRSNSRLNPGQTPVKPGATAGSTLGANAVPTSPSRSPSLSNPLLLLPALNAPQASPRTLPRRGAAATTTSPWAVSPPTPRSPAPPRAGPRRERAPAPHAQPLPLLLPLVCSLSPARPNPELAVPCSPALSFCPVAQAACARRGPSEPPPARTPLVLLRCTISLLPACRAHHPPSRARAQNSVIRALRRRDAAGPIEGARAATGSPAGPGRRRRRRRGRGRSRSLARALPRSGDARAAGGRAPLIARAPLAGRRARRG
jgi:hypothetical protein